MRIIEEEIIGKTSRELCEDGIAVNSNFVAVVDGSTSKTPLCINDTMTNGRYCMQLVCSLINTMDKDISMESFCLQATKMINQIYCERGIDINILKDDPVQRMAASVIIYSDRRKEIWMVGDCHCIVDGVYYDNPKPYESSIAAKRAEIIKKALAEGISETELRNNDIGRKAILPLLRKACKEQNVSYPVIDGFPIPIEYVKVVKTRQEGSEIILASDGYPHLMTTLRESEAELNRLLRDDPLCIKENIATKGLMIGQTSFDDRSYIRLTN